MSLDPAVFIAFLIGTATGAAGHYFGEKKSDRRREKEAAKASLKRFRDLHAKMPVLMQEMRNDLALDGMALVREFFVLPSKGVTIGFSSKSRFRYFENEHDSLREKLDLLLHAGFIVDASPSSTPIFRMEETFVELLQKELK